MAVECRVTLVKTFTYRGAPEEWSNTYILSGPTPADNTAWNAVVDKLAAEERKCYSGATSIVRAYGYDGLYTPGQHAVFDKDWSAGGLTPLFGQFNPPDADMSSPGDVAAWLRFDTGKLNSIGKKIYLRKYFHDVYAQTGSARDTLSVAQKTAIDAFGAALLAGLVTGPPRRR